MQGDLPPTEGCCGCSWTVDVTPKLSLFRSHQAFSHLLINWSCRITRTYTGACSTGTWIRTCQVVHSSTTLHRHSRLSVTSRAVQGQQQSSTTTAAADGLVAPGLDYWCSTTTVHTAAVSLSTTAVQYTLEPNISPGTQQRLGETYHLRKANYSK